MADYVIRISEDGFSHLDGDAHLSFNSDYPVLKIFEHGTWSINYPGGLDGASIVIPHNLQYKPMFFVFGSAFPTFGGIEDGAYVQYPFIQYAGLGQYDAYLASVDETTLTISISPALHNDYAEDYSGFYIIFYDPLT